MSTSGKSENNKMHSLNPELNSLSLNWVRTDNPICNGNEESPKRSLSHKCRILCSGNTSEEKKVMILTLEESLDYIYVKTL